MAGWTLDDIPWQQLDRSAVTPDILALVKAASMVEANAPDYREYLCNVFADDPRVCRAIDGWAEEEAQHGAALARWATLADPAFDFDKSFQAFLDGYRIPIEATSSVRGSRCGEMVARCMVETGTNSFYSALAQATKEPVLADICRRIADDELAHFNLFHRHMNRYLQTEELGGFERFKIAFGRIAEADDDELAYAYYAANCPDGPYRRRYYASLYHRAALAHYTPSIVGGAVRLFLRTLNLGADGWIAKGAGLVSYGLMAVHRFRLAATVSCYRLTRSASRKGVNSETAAS
jgi:rubrerythrin